ncbi:hypothetical protein C1637_05340 [Chryseobacterium lactis]|uniref:Uncharacterized protein n=1 Tax=Chryseobacterium lactis TaxID=1241981 RepID=A0A3G6RNR7_CHRLC|nr:hypothetical protein EG342_21310 [Chryseobacterium lactis]AZB04657.1 hypothetical protein EG341_12190 [Chryseobacterium lactis]PNW14388.1 hypothetical protein C1637_05340 [Chryseobacterium lactis]
MYFFMKIMYLGVTKLKRNPKSIESRKKIKKCYYEKPKKTFKKRIENRSGRYPNVFARIFLVLIRQKMYRNRITVWTY